MKPLNIEGLVTATVTPMKDNGDVWEEKIGEQVDHLVSEGMAGMYVLGSTGEGMLLGDDERKLVAEKFIEAAAGRIPVFVQVGHGSWRAAGELARHAAEVGADAISATPPGYFKPESAHVLVDGLGEICEKAPEIPFYYYHIPQLSGVSVDIFEMTKLAKERLGNFVGIKYSDGATLYQLQRLQEMAPTCEFLGGSDEAYLMSVAQGYDACVGSTYGFMKPVFDRVREAVLSGDLPKARVWQNRALGVIDLLFSTCGRAGLKAMYTMRGVPMGASRNPIVTPSEAQMTALRSGLEELGFFDWLDSKVLQDH